MGEELRSKGKLENIGGLAYLSHLAGNTPTSINAKYYAQIVTDRAFERNLIETSSRIAGMAYESHGSTADLYAKACIELQRVEPTNGIEVVYPSG